MKDTTTLTVPCQLEVTDLLVEFMECLYQGLVFKTKSGTEYTLSWTQDGSMLLQGGGRTIVLDGAYCTATWDGKPHFLGKYTTQKGEAMEITTSTIMWMQPIF